MSWVINEGGDLTRPDQNYSMTTTPLPGNNRTNHKKKTKKKSSYETKTVRNNLKGTVWGEGKRGKYVEGRGRKE